MRISFAAVVTGKLENGETGIGLPIPTALRPACVADGERSKFDGIKKCTSHAKTAPAAGPGPYPAGQRRKKAFMHGLFQGAMAASRDEKSRPTGRDGSLGADPPHQNGETLTMPVNHW